ncbi:cysteine--tRNA ligase [Actinospongicola halichondriae]|uniref:cysteine--tRNA ligase n=1 Tax=Actinospongicola halichondriae TaxID=3236844 RepID=UPI003D53AFD2
MLHLHDTARRAVVPFVPREPGKVSIYACGPTVYGPPHLGHGRNQVTYDLLRRYLTWAGNDVTFVSNITDIDDKIIERANTEARPWQDITRKCEAVWFQAMDRLGIMRPEATPHATEYVEQMVALIERLVADDVAYETSDGVYLDVSKVDGYGLLAHGSLEDLRSGARVEANVEKRSPLDFALWKKAKPGEPSWPAPFGDGRPGWHTECVVMSIDILGEGFDIHAGGSDLQFPHHENERAQAVAEGKSFANWWFHHGMVEIDGEKMSKSLGNVTSLLDLLDLFDPRAFRLLILQAHYRSPIDIAEDAMRSNEAALARLDTFARTFAADAASVDSDPTVLDRFRQAMDDDLDTPAAMATLFDAVRDANKSRDLAVASAALEIAAALGIELAGEAAAVPAEITALAAQRDQARADKDFPEADRLRDEIEAAGYVVEDSAAGTAVRAR